MHQRIGGSGFARAQHPPVFVRQRARVRVPPPSMPIYQRLISVRRSFLTLRERTPHRGACPRSIVRAQVLWCNLRVKRHNRRLDIAAAVE